jgi:hypothetical protein
MSLVSGIYDNGPISPIVKIDENIRVDLNDKSYYYQVKFLEGIPRSTPFTIDLIAAAGVTTLATANRLQAQIVAVLQVSDDEMIQMRFKPIDLNVEGELYQLGGVARFNNPQGGQARVTQMTGEHDPNYASTTFFVIGRNKDAQIGVFNNGGVAVPQARFAFWGFRYILKEISRPVTPYTIIPGQGRA